MLSRPYRLLVLTALIMAALTAISSAALDLPISEPDSFLGPEWVQEVVFVLGAFGADIVPRAVWRGRGRPVPMYREAIAVIRGHWSTQRATRVVVGITCFFVTYVSYRNLKSYLPFARTTTYDYALHHVDHVLLFGHDPALLLHGLLGTGLAAEILALAYLLFLPLVPITVTAWAVWARPHAAGLWYLTADCLCWSLGTVSYYLIPTLGPNFAFPWLYHGIASTGVSAMQDALLGTREALLHAGNSQGVQSLAAFASLHVAITLMMCLLAHWTVPQRWVSQALWAYLVLVVISTTYFGWHYIVDDLAGAGIALVAVYGAGWATGYHFDRWGHLLTTPARNEANSSLTGVGGACGGRPCNGRPLELLRSVNRDASRRAQSHDRAPSMNEDLLHLIKGWAVRRRSYNSTAGQRPP